MASSGFSAVPRERRRKGGEKRRGGASVLGQGPRTRRNVAWTWPTHTDPSVVEDQLIFPRMAPRAPASAPLGPKLNPLLTSYEPCCCIIKGTSCNWTRPPLLPFFPPIRDSRDTRASMIEVSSIILALCFEQSGLLQREKTIMKCIFHLTLVRRVQRRESENGISI